MLFLSSQIKNQLPQWNEKEFGEADCWHYAQKHRIWVKRSRFRAAGYFGRTRFRNKKKYFIVLDERLKGVRLLNVFLHEIGHHCLHEPVNTRQVFYYRRRNTKEEFEANVFAAVAMIPKHRLFELVGEDDLNPFTMDVCDFRWQLYEKYKI